MIERSQKKCTTCKSVKRLSEFRSHNRTNDGHAHSCKECQKYAAPKVKSSRVQAIEKKKRAQVRKFTYRSRKQRIKSLHRMYRVLARRGYTGGQHEMPLTSG